jgi:hypothetical protein
MMQMVRLTRRSPFLLVLLLLLLLWHYPLLSL